jgi:uncharacterized membrane protein (UPF0127 family)
VPLLTIVLAVAACDAFGTPSGPPSGSSLPSPLAGLPVTTASIDGREFDVIVAETPTARARGLMGVASLAPFDAMVFVHEGTVEASYWMKDVLMPLDIAFIGEDGTVVGVQTMPVCAADPCPRFRSPAPFRYALEMPAGGLEGVEVGAAFELRPVAP